MAGIPSLTCPECGRIAKSERALTKKPARKLRRAVAIILALAAWPLAHVPRTVERGPVALVPGWLLARTAPTNGTQFDILTLNNRGAPLRMRAAVLAQPPDTLTDKLQSAFFIECWSRLEDDELGDAAGTAYLRRLHAKDPDRDYELNFPPAWPTDRAFDLPAQNWNPIFSSTGRLRSTRSIYNNLLPTYEWKATYKPGSAPTLIHRATVGKRTYDLAPSAMSIDLSTPAATFMRPVSSPVMDRTVVDLLFPRLHIFNTRATLYAGGTVQQPPTGDVPWYGVFNIVVLVDDQEVASGQGGWAGGREIPFSIDWRDGGEARAAAAPDSVTLKITGDEKEAWRAYAFDWTRPRVAWAGSATLKPAISRGDR